TTYTYLSNDVIKENDDTLNDHPFATPDYLANLTYPGIPNHELKLKFPLRLAYATTFNSCQGLTLDRVVIDLQTHVFAHGQLYTALSRVQKKDHALIILPKDNINTKTINI
ncbi:16845_t:CDS:2, partial [Cetraspora pellucida]